MHGVELVEAVIRKVQDEGFGVFSGSGTGRIEAPRPVPAEVLAELRFPNGKPLPPSLVRWLAFDASWLGWFADPNAPEFVPRTLGEYAAAEFSDIYPFDDFALDGECYQLHFGVDTRRLLYVGEPDSMGEYPVLLIDTDDASYVCVEYPGFDVYLAVHARIVDKGRREYGALRRHPIYGWRMQEHADRYFGGEAGKSSDELGARQIRGV